MSDLSATLMQNEPAAGVDRKYLHPGHSFHSLTPAIVTTILGSCVSVCLWDDVRGVGGLTHYLLPTPLNGRVEASRFGTTAIPQLIEQLRALGARHLSAKIFGGSAINAALAAEGRDLGTRNVEVAVETLEAHRIAIVAKDVGGSSGRKLVFQTDSGHVWIKRLEAQQP